MAVAPPRPKFPPLNALRAFEAAARLGGFAAAAEELCVTPGAIGQHVKLLEAWAGAPLFQRHSRGVALSDLGERVHAEFSVAFDRLGEATQSLRRSAAPRQLLIATLPSIAQLWLAPRLARARKAVPGVELSVTAMEKPPNLKREPFDLAIFFHDGAPGPDAVAVCEDEIFPVCAPRLAAALRAPGDLAGQILLHDSAWSGDWAQWLKAAGTATAREGGGPAFSLYGLAVEEAKAGAGVMIAHAPLLADLLASGALVEPFDLRVWTGRWLYLHPARPKSQSDRLHAVMAALLYD